MTDLEKKEEVTEEKETIDTGYKPLKQGQIPISGDYEGKEQDFGKSGRNFKFYVNGVDAADNDKVIDIPVKTPKNRHMIKYVLLTTRMRKLSDIDADIDFFDQILDFIETYYNVPSSYMDRIDPTELMKLINFISVISITPSRN